MPWRSPSSKLLRMDDDMEDYEGKAPDEPDRGDDPRTGFELKAKRELIRQALRTVLFDNREQGEWTQDEQANAEQAKADVDEDYDLILAFDKAARAYVEALDLAGH